MVQNPITRIDPQIGACAKRQGITALPCWISLLLGRRELTVGSAQLVLDLESYDFAVRTHCHTRDADHLPVALVGFLDRVLSHALHGDAGSPGIPFVRRVRAIQ